ncbi:MAG: hypothetical protein WB341_12625 [Terracidiphilus sp.]
MQFPEGEPNHDVVIEIGGLPIEVQTSDAEFERILKGRYGEYVRPGGASQFALRVELTTPETFDSDADAEVWLEDREWRMERGDFRARWNPADRQGQVVQSANPYSIDSVLRIVHTLMLAPEGGFLLHASSAVRNGKAFLFSGVSEAGKTTMARLAPADATLLTDEASYVRKVDGRYVAYGTPFAGEMGEPGKNISAPIAALYFLKKAPENRIEEMEPGVAVRRLLRNILFFAHQPEMVRQVFESACAFVAAVPVYQLSFFPDQRVWELIG